MVDIGLGNPRDYYMPMHVCQGVTVWTLLVGIQVHTNCLTSTSEYLLAPCGIKDYSLGLASVPSGSLTK